MKAAKLEGGYRPYEDLRREILEPKATLTAEDQPMAHAMNCGDYSGREYPCTCGLQCHIYLQTDPTMPA